MAVVALGGLMTEDREPSARTVMLEFVEILRPECCMYSGETVSLSLPFRSDSDGRVGSEGAIEDSILRCVLDDPCLEAGVGDGSCGCIVS